MRPIDPNHIKGVTIATRAGPFRPLLSKHSGMGTSQPCAMHKTETAAMAIQPPGATWRHYNPERGERVVRKAVLARCVISNTKRPQQPNIADDDGGQRRFDVGHRLGADYANRDILTSRSLHPAKHRSCRTPSNSSTIRASRHSPSHPVNTPRRLNTHEDLNLRVPPPGGPYMHRACLLCECYVSCVLLGYRPNHNYQ